MQSEEHDQELAGCLATADRAFSVGQCAVAIRNYERALLCFQQMGISDGIRLRDCLKNLSDLYLLQDEPTQALEVIVSLRLIEDSPSFKHSHVTALLKTAITLEGQAKFEEAENLLQQALSLANDFLPATDPLIDRLNKVRLETQKKAMPESKSDVPGADANKMSDPDPGLSGLFKKAASGRKSRVSFMDRKLADSPPATAEAQAIEIADRQAIDEDLAAYAHEIDNCIQSGDLALEGRDYHSSVANFSQAVQMLNKLTGQETDKLKHCFSALIESHLHLEDADNALAALDQMGKIDAQAVKTASTINVLSGAAILYAKNNRYEDSWATYWKALELAGNVLPVDHPLVEELNQSYIELQRKYSDSDSIRAPLKDAEAQDVLAGSRRRRLTNWNEKPAAATNPVSTPGRTEAAAPERNQMLDKLSGAAARAFEQKSVRVALQAPWFLLLVTSLFVFVCVQLSTVPFAGKAPRGQQTAVPDDFTGMSFQSCDEKVSIKFLTKEACAINKSGRIVQVKYTVLPEAMPDLSSLLLGYLQSNQVWYRYDTGRLGGNDKVVLYSSTAPELAVVRRMWWYADFAQQYYRESKLYPADAEKCKQADPKFIYFNAFTGQPDYAAIVLQKQIDGAANYKTGQGLSQRHWRPGAIFCLNTEYKSFIVQGFDRYGQLLSSSEPDHSLTIVCQNGIDLTKRDQLRGEPITGTDTSPTRIFISGSENMAAIFQWVRSLGQILMWSWLFISCFWSYACHKSKSSRKAMFASVISAVLSLVCLITWYFLALQPS